LNFLTNASAQEVFKLKTNRRNGEQA